MASSRFLWFVVCALFIGALVQWQRSVALVVVSSVAPRASPRLRELSTPPFPPPQPSPKTHSPPPVPPPPPPLPPVACPLVFLYNTSVLLRDHATTLYRDAYGPSLGDMPGLYDSQQHAVGALLLSRLLRSARCRTDDPARASLFVVPLLFKPPRAPTKEESAVVWEFMPPNTLEMIKPVCDLLATTNWRIALPHLNTQTAARHLFVPGGTQLEIFYQCARIDKAFDERFNSGADAPLLAQFAHLETGTVGDPKRAVMSMPLVSSVHLRSAELVAGRPPWALRDVSARPWLLSYGGSLMGSPEAKAIRAVLVEKCRAYGNATCRLLNCNNDNCIMASADSLRRAFDAKRTSVFCLEPPGFGWERKSMADALTLGCIPVTFTPERDREIWPVHWGPWRAQSRVLLDGRRVVSGEIDVLSQLRSIPHERVRAMQRSIAANAHRIHYALDDSPGDALEVLLDSVSRPPPRWLRLALAVKLRTSG